MKTLSFFLISAVAAQLSARTAQVTWKYQDANTMAIKRAVSSTSIPEKSVSDPKMKKTLFAVSVGNTLKKSLKDYEEACKVSPVDPIPFPRPIDPIPFPRPIDPRTMPPHSETCSTGKRVGKSLSREILNLAVLADSISFVRQDAGLIETLDLARKLASNMKKGRAIYSHSALEGIRSLSLGGPSGSVAGLNITSGGAQDFGFFRKTVTDGLVPVADSLKLEGFLKEFDLSLTMEPCQELICVKPAISVNDKHMFIQIGMNSNVTRETFARKPLNLSLVLDISGSMSATDNTEKNRLEWAKEALLKTLDELNAKDMVSVVIFDGKSEVLVPPQFAGEKDAIRAKVRALSTRGSTNVEAGLRDGYELVSQNLEQLTGYENRVILISDAGLNTGITDEAALLRLVTDYANEGIGLTALGLGLNFNDSFIHGITRSRGGNYQFVHSGKDMYRYFEAFNFLVTPVAYGFKASLDLDGVTAKLVNAYGIPAKEGEPVREFIDVQTLFFSENGGAMILEYEIQ